VGLPVYIVVLLADVRTLKSDKGMHKRKEMLGIRIPYLVCVPHMMSHRTAGLLVLLHRFTEATHSSRSGGSPSLLPWHASWVDVVDVWARSPLTVNGALHDLNHEEVEARSMPLTIPDVGSEWPLRFSSTV
jgi:hypothetical protein